VSLLVVICVAKNYLLSSQFLYALLDIIVDSAKTFVMFVGPCRSDRC